MRCPELSEQLSAYIDGMLDPSQVHQVEEHLQICTACRLEYEELKAVVMLVRELPEVVPTPEFRASLGQKLQHLPRPIVHTDPVARSFFRRWYGIFTAAALLFIALGMTTLWSNQQLKSTMLGLVTLDGQRPIQETEDMFKEHSAKDLSEVLVGNDQGDTDTQKLAQNTESEEKMEQANDTTKHELKGTEAVPKRDGQGALSAPTPAKQQQQEQYEDLAASNIVDEQHNQSMLMMEKMHYQEDTSEPIGYGQKSISEARPLVALEYTLTLTTDQKDVAQRISEMVDRHGGYVETEPRGGENKVLRLPPAQVEFFLNDIKQLGRVEYHQISRDLTDEYLQAQDVYLALLRQEQQRTAIRDELVSLDKQIEVQQRALAELNQSIELAKVELVIIHK